MTERRSVLRTFGPECKLRLSSETEPRLSCALQFAERAHGPQRRPAGEPYVEHLREVISVLVDGLGITDADLLVAAALHDVVEDTDTTIDQIREEFGDSVAALVGWVTKGPKEDKRAYLARLADAPSDVVLLKLADRLSNVQRLDTHPRPEKRARYYAETVQWIVPLARRHPWFDEWFSNWQRDFEWLNRS
ncbi:HD domain-containing protein [Nocardia nova]|uniref:HD domain-containing protein n=1 Tax=Nocardia nova TaxID=37330 RepID=UPI001CA5F3F5|nr:HD domain-containing protein [Nocardia nova]